MVWVFCAVPLMPIVLSAGGELDPSLRPRRAATGLWLLFGVLAAAAIPWDERISSNGYRLLLILVVTALVARIAIGVLGVMPEQMQRVEQPSPDMLGIDRPLTRSDALDAGRVLGIDEEEFDALAPASGPTAAGAHGGGPSVSALTVQHLTVRFGGHLAVGDVSLTVEAGSIAGLIGPNGAGKTTTFNAICGVLTPTSGTVRLDGP